ncbi:MAG: zinc-ribbon domain-containing protein [Acidobacteriota bacterium]
MNCSECGSENSMPARFCQMCAAPLGIVGDYKTREDRAARSESPSLATTIAFPIESPDPRICTVCDAVNEAEWLFCQQCGSKLGQIPDASIQDEGTVSEPKRRYATTVKSSPLVEETNKDPGAGHVTCPKCSQRVVEGAAFCYKCGTPLSSSTTVVMSSVRPSVKGRLLLFVDGEATGDEYELKRETVIGRTSGDITFPHDDYMSGSHARIAKRGDKFMLIDEDSRNGSFIRIKKEVEIKPGDFVLLGKQLFRFEL